MTKPPKPTLNSLLQAKGLGPMSGSPVPKMPSAASEDVEADSGADPASNRMRVVVRLNVEAVEALENVVRKKRRQIGRAVPMQAVLEEAIEDILRKYGEPAVVLPAPTKRGR